MTDSIIALVAGTLNRVFDLGLSRSRAEEALLDFRDALESDSRGLQALSEVDLSAGEIRRLGLFARLWLLSLRTGSKASRSDLEPADIQNFMEAAGDEAAKALTARAIVNAVGGNERFLDFVLQELDEASQTAVHEARTQYWSTREESGSAPQSYFNSSDWEKGG